ncbi:glycosyltransferase family 39 protein, partial [bacterium]|nr:glycosyltransferase family 39 protein [bacterium]
MQKRYKVILGVLLLAVYCFAFQGERGLFDPDEGRYSAVALQMIKSHDWLNPHTHPDHEHLAKPPLAYWAIASSLLTFGKNEFAVRFPNALAFFVSIIFSFYLGKVFVPKRPWIVSLIFATFLFPATVCNGATTDYMLTVWETMAVCFFAHAFWRKKGNERLTLILFMWISFGLAFLTKGPPSLLPLFSIIVFLQFKCTKKQDFNMYWVRGLLILLFIASSWFLGVILKNHELMRYFLWDEIVLRVFTSHHARHSSWYAAFYIFLPVLVFGTF